MNPGKSFKACIRSLETLSGEGRERQLKMLEAAWDRAFLNYRDGHWHDPEMEYAGEPDLPEIAVPFLMILLREKKMDPVRVRDVVQGYIEFFAAVKDSLFSAEQQRLLHPVLLEAEKRWPDRAEGFRTLLNSILISSDAYGDRRMHTPRPSQD